MRRSIAMRRAARRIPVHLVVARTHRGRDALHMRAQLEQIAAELDVALSADVVEGLIELVRLCRAYAPAINLVGAHDDVAMIGHVADGLATVSCAAGLLPMTRATTWLDVGSGAGLLCLVNAATTES